MLDKIDHVGIAVSDLDAAIDFYRDTFGAEPVSREMITSDGVEEAMIPVGESFVQLLCPTGEDTTVGRFIARNGEGLHHLGFQVPDLPKALEELKSKGARLIDEEPRRGGGGAWVAFVHPKGAHGTLIELVEEGSGSHGH